LTANETKPPSALGLSPFSNSEVLLALESKSVYRFGMESIIRNVGEIDTDERRVYESVLGHTLGENHRVIIRVVELGDEPDKATRTAALARAVEIARQSHAAAAAQGITPEEADAVVDEAIQEVRRSNP
jgi:hypothetical protein